MKPARMTLATLADPPRKKRAPKPRPFPLSIDDIEGMPEGQRVVLHFPPVACNPNFHGARRTHWAAKKSYRWECFVEARKAHFTKSTQCFRGTTGKVHLRIDFFPPPGVALDKDNCIASFKAGQDGIAEALGVDDGRFEVEHVLHVQKRCCVVVTLLSTSGVAL